MNRADRKRWASARTLADLGNLTALWLEGEIRKMPNYDGPPAPETRELVPVLAALNRAGLVTHGSQPGEADSGNGWEQRAAVECFASPDLAGRLHATLEDGPGFLVRVREASRRMSWKGAIPVSLDQGQVFTQFGVQLSRRFLRDSWEGYGTCHGEAVAALCGARQVTIVDPQWGRNDRLWPVLERFAAQEVSAS